MARGLAFRRYTFLVPRPESLRSAPDRSPTHHFAVGLARAVGGAIIFGLPLLMTMEMWSLGFTMDPLRLALLIVLTIPLLVGLSHVSGFEETFGVRDDLVDAFVACLVGFVVSAAALMMFGVIQPGMPAAEVVGKVAIQAVPASMGALLAHSLLVQEKDPGDEEAAQERRRPSTYFSQIFLMAAGALFLAFNLAPTEEMPLIAYIMGPERVLAMVALSLALMHAFVYAVEFSGQEVIHPDTPFWSVFLRFTVVGYAVALLISAYVLWTFGRLDDTGGGEALTNVLVLGFPAAVGAAAARLIL